MQYLIVISNCPIIRSKMVTSLGAAILRIFTVPNNRCRILQTLDLGYFTAVYLNNHNIFMNSKYKNNNNNNNNK